MAYTSGKTVNDFIEGFNGGTRLNRFQVNSTCNRISKPYHVRAAQIPGSTINTIGLNWFGRTIEVPGERSYTPWAITVLDDTGTSEVYNSFVAWQHAIGNMDTNTFVKIRNSTTGASNDNGCNFNVIQYSTHNDFIEKRFTLYNAWPVQISALELDMSKDNVLGQFNVVLAYSHFSYGTSTNPT
jgi:hypothetical protein